MARAIPFSPLLLVVAAKVRQGFAAQVRHGLVQLVLYESRHRWVLDGGDRPGVSLTIHSD